MRLNKLMVNFIVTLD